MQTADDDRATGWQRHWKEGVLPSLLFLSPTAAYLVSTLFRHPALDPTGWLLNIARGLALQFTAMFALRAVTVLVASYRVQAHPEFNWQESVQLAFVVVLAWSCAANAQLNGIGRFQSCFMYEAGLSSRELTGEQVAAAVYRCETWFDPSSDYRE